RRGGRARDWSPPPRAWPAPAPRSEGAACGVRRSQNYAASARSVRPNRLALALRSGRRNRFLFGFSFWKKLIQSFFEYGSNVKRCAVDRDLTKLGYCKGPLLHCSGNRSSRTTSPPPSGLSSPPLGGSAVLPAAAAGSGFLPAALLPGGRAVGFCALLSLPVG